MRIRGAQTETPGRVDTFWVGMRTADVNAIVWLVIFCAIAGVLTALIGSGI